MAIINRRFRSQLIALILLVSTSAISGEFRVSANNDIVYNSDKHYTHGTMISYIYEVEPYPQMILDEPVTAKRHSFGQYMYTPSDISISELIEDDRPYAGILYLETSEYMPSGNRLQSVSLIIGAVGSWSVAEATQKWVHDTWGAQPPKGWDNQIDDELVFSVVYVDRHRFYKSDYIDVIGHYGESLGTLHTYANAGGTLKFGWNVPNSYDMNRLDPLPRDFYDSFSVYTFVSVGGRAVIRNIFLDGNTFSSSHSVKKEFFVGDFVSGLAISLYNVDITFYASIITEEFEGQNGNSEFGGLSIAYKW